MYRKLLSVFIILFCTEIIYAKQFDHRISRMQFFGSDNSLIYEMHLYYNEDGSLVMMKQFDSNMFLVGVEEYLLDEKGTRSRENIYNSRRELERYALVDYTGGNKTRKVYDVDDILLSVIEYEYDSRGNVKKIVETSPAGEIISVSDYSSPGPDRIKCNRRIQGNSEDYYYVIWFSSNGIISEVIYHSSDGTKAGFARIIVKEGEMTEQSQYDLIYL